jgi:hypothetical protein
MFRDSLHGENGTLFIVLLLDSFIKSKINIFQESKIFRWEISISVILVTLVGKVADGTEEPSLRGQKQGNECCACCYCY